jgi:hypothetical protein
MVALNGCNHGEITVPADDLDIHTRGPGFIPSRLIGAGEVELYRVADLELALGTLAPLCQRRGGWLCRGYPGLGRRRLSTRSSSEHHS